MHLTFHTRLANPAQTAFLTQMAAAHATVERKMYAAMAAGKADEASFKKRFSAGHDLTSRQFNTMAVEIKGKIKGVREALQSHVEILEARLTTLKKATADLARMIKRGTDAKGRALGKAKIDRKRRNLHEKKRKIERLKYKISALKARIEAPVPGICFGSRVLFKEQFKDGVDQAQWATQWRDRRNSQFLLIGAAEEEAGCASCQATLEDDGTITLRVRPFNSLLAKREKASGKPAAEMKRRKTITAKASDFVEIRGLRFRHGAKYIHDALIRNAGNDKAARTPLSWRFVRDDAGAWYVYLSLNVPEAITFDASGGAMGVDFNEDHIAATVVDRDGNYVACKRFPLNVYGLSSLRAKDTIRCAARDVVAWAKELGVPVVGEELDFSKKKRSMAGLSAKRSRQLSSLHYSAWRQALQSRCLREGVALKLVNPAYSSLIGRVKFSALLGLSVHHAAAMVIARRGMSKSERLPRLPVGIPDGKGAHVTLHPAASMGWRHVWVAWAKLAKDLNEARAAQFSGRKGTSRAAGQAPKPVLDDAIPDFPQADLGEMASLELHGEIPRLRPDLPVDGRLSYCGLPQ